MEWIFIRLYNTWFDKELGKGRPIEELPIPAEVQAEGKEAVRKYINERRLAYYDNAQVWWCNHCKTVCANEEVLNDGSHEKCGTKEVERRLNSIPEIISVETDTEEGEDEIQLVIKREQAQKYGKQGEG